MEYRASTLPASAASLPELETAMTAALEGGDEPLLLYFAAHGDQGETARDQAKIDDLGNQLVWQTRIFEDRQRVIKFVCEVPTAIDQRLFALGRTIQQEIE